MLSPIEHVNLFGDKKTLPSVTTFVRVETDETVRIDPVNDLIIMSAFRDGKPGELRRFREVSDLEAVHDPDQVGDQGVKLAGLAKSGFSDREVFGAPVEVTLRVNPATAAKATIDDGGGNDLIDVTRKSYGTHANGPGVTIDPGTVEGKMVTLASATGAPIIGDNLGLLIDVQYTGDATTATITILSAGGTIDYSAGGQPTDGETVTVNGVIFEFDNDATVTGTNVAVAIGTSADVTWATLAAAIGANVSLAVIHDTVNDRLTVDGADDGVVLATTAINVTVATFPPAARLQVALAGDETDGSEDLDVQLTLGSLSSIDKLVGHINNKLGYTASVRATANKFIASTGLDPLASTNVKAAPVILAGFNASLVDFITNRTRERYSAVELGPRGIPNEATYTFSGGTAPPATIIDWSNALDIIAEGQPGGILLIDSDDTAVFALMATWIEEQRSAGRYFRVFAGAQPGLTVSQYDTIAQGIDHERFRLAVERPGILGASGGVEYLHPVFYAAALAGGAAGNRSYARPLTDQVLRFVDVHEGDRHTTEELGALLNAGITVMKRAPGVIRCALAVTTSRDPNKRIPRVMSEIDTVDEIDNSVRDRLQSLIGSWTTPEIVSRARVAVDNLLQEYVDLGALSPGTNPSGVEVPAYQVVSVVVQAGALQVKYQIHIGGELDFIDAIGHANYVRIEERDLTIPLAA